MPRNSGPTASATADASNGRFDWISSHLSIKARLSLVCVALIIPLIMAIGLLVKAGIDEIQFTQLERQGLARQVASWSAIIGDSTFAASEDDAGFKSTDAARALAGAATRSERISNGAHYLVALADGSNLTLDPELHTFYLMDAMTARLPALLVQIQAEKAQLTRAAAAASSGALIAPFETVLPDYLATLQGSLSAAYRSEASGQSRKTLSKLETDFATKINVVAAAAAGATDADRQAAEDALDLLWRATASELDAELKARVDGLVMALALEVSVTILALLIALTLTVIVGKGLTRRISGTVTAMERLSANDLAAEVPFLSDVNETGRMAAALARFKTGFLERAELQAAVAASAAETAAKLSALEAEFRVAGETQNAVVASVADALKRLAAADLAFRINEAFPNEYETLRNDFNGAVSELQAAMKTIAANTAGMSRGAEEITQAADDLSRRTEQQAATLEETAAALDQITATVRRPAEGAAKANSVVESARGDAETSREVVRSAVEAMHGIERSSGEIAQIIGVIDEIAFQTNLLALNAGVEAARAGDAGRGFAVVASEVRALAQRSAQAAKEIKTLISTSTGQVKQGVDLVGRTGEALQRIVGQVGEITSLVSEIAASSREQATALAEVNTAVNQMDQMTQQNAAMVEQSTAASHSLAQEAGVLASLVGRFQVGSAVAVAAADRTPVANSGKRAIASAQARVARYASGDAAPVEAWRDF